CPANVGTGVSIVGADYASTEWPDGRVVAKAVAADGHVVAAINGPEVVQQVPECPEKGASSGSRRTLRLFFRIVVGQRATGLCPVVAGVLSGVQTIAVRSYLYPGAFFSASLVVFMTRYHLLLLLVVAWIAFCGTATYFSPAPRKPPAPTIK